MDTFKLGRSSDRPLEFTGELLAEADTRMSAGQDHQRWHELALYRTAGGTYVLAIGYRTQWQGETDHDAVYTAADAGDITEMARRYDPVGRMLGYPPGRQFEEKQARVRLDITARFSAALGEILSALGGERID